MVAARANMTTIVRMLHDPSSQMMDMLLAALREGRICVIDVSQMRGTPALVLSGLILRRIFDHNQEEFTKAQPETIPVIAVVEEAQAVLGSTGSSGEGPYVSWVKEGRKYDLGAVLITQQPGSISGEILSQGDNWRPAARGLCAHSLPEVSRRTPSGLFVPHEKLLRQLPGQAVGAVRRKAQRRYSRLSTAPPLDVFSPTRPARLVRARPQAAGPAGANGLCGHPEDLSGPV